MSDIQYTYPLIHNKVTSPHYVTPTLRRARLLDWLHDNADCRATVIAADAGYGKTTLLWQWEREVGFPCYWYKLDRNDRDWSLHISYLIEAISQRHAGFGRRAHSMLQQLGGPGSSRPGVAAFLLSEMHQRLTEPCTFIVDDWQYVNSVTEVRGLWNQILRDAPPTCRFVFASRVKPRLQFARFKTHAGYAELRTDALRFTDNEIDELFREIYQDPLDPAELAELERRTEGWAASLQLVEVSLRERHTPESRQDFIQSITGSSDSDLFAFLAEEVLEQQTEQTRNFLLTTSIVQQITPELAERLAGVHDGGRELVDLEQRGLFTYRLDEARYRYHNLFREFLKRRLVQERSESEVTGLHIHAASYFETTQQWPEAIHHYLRAGLQRQAARLIARYGEEVVSEGRLGLVDEWLRQLPERSIRENARLSLLDGEAHGIRGNWEAAIDALQRARSFFARKGDGRMEALACLKLSSVYTNYGDVQQAAECARQGLELVPPDAVATRLRLEGNLAVTHTWVNDHVEAVANACRRIAVEAHALGQEHFAAIALHNLGTAQRHLGQVDDAVRSLERAAAFWDGLAASPFADNFELVLALLATDNVQRAQQVADTAVRRTAPWPRPQADALLGRAAVLAHQGRFGEATAILAVLSSSPTYLGSINEPAGALLIDCMYMGGAGAGELAAALQRTEAGPVDSRHAVVMAPARALVAHARGDCHGQCDQAREVLSELDERGERLPVTNGYVKLALLALEHDRRRALPFVIDALARTLTARLARPLRWWIRRYAPHAATIGRHPRGGELLAALLDADPDGWRLPVVSVLPQMSVAARERLLPALVRYANKEVVENLKRIPGDDVAGATRQVLQHQAARLFVRSFGVLTVHRGQWSGPRLSVEKRRQRMLLGLLVLNSGTTLTRDAALDILWPDADPAAAINSLNQTVFQLRRVLDPTYRDGESVNYILSTSDALELNRDLVRTDVEEIRRLRLLLSSAQTAAQREAAAAEIVSLVRGEFLAELKYEDWVSGGQTAVHAEVRHVLLPIATRADMTLSADVAVRAACSLIALDEFDEAAHIALAESLAASGKRLAARDVIARYARKLDQELDERPSADVARSMEALGAPVN